MRKLQIYLDTSVINFLFADDAPEKKEITIDFFENFVRKNLYDVFISPIVIDEINKTTDEITRQKLLNVIKEYNIEVINISEKQEEIEKLAYLYINKTIIPKKKIEDALHIAICSIFNIDILLSWNYRHMANVNKESKIMSVNISEGYNKQLKIITPMEVIYEE
ncbi:MAG: PIN domain-containing protein [Desulfobacterales bacterium]|nr:PIN domain-containing protein [Desulfobacterales bacterium]